MDVSRDITSAYPHRLSLSAMLSNFLIDYRAELEEETLDDGDETDFLYQWVDYEVSTMKSGHMIDLVTAYGIGEAILLQRQEEYGYQSKTFNDTEDPDTVMSSLCFLIIKNYIQNAE